MRRGAQWGWAGVLALAAVSLGGCGQPAGDAGDAGMTDGDVGAESGVDPPSGDPGPLEPRVENRTCRLPPAPPIGAMRFTSAFEGLQVSRPIWFGTAPGDEGARYVVEQSGRIRVFEPDRPRDATVFFERPVSRDNNEEGLLGLAFHPRYADNGLLYIYYSAANPRRSIISELRRHPMDPRRADAGSERVLLEVAQPYGNHNGGDLHFGPDGLLYISLGDGGAGGDPEGHGQRTETLLGSILRIDVDRTDPACGLAYGIPPSNPFAAERCQPGEPGAGRPEIWAWGLRNVWRMSFDRATGELWGADVGQDEEEEVNLIEGGHNYGWNAVEGRRCFVDGCDQRAYTAPVWSYTHDQGESVTGGYVYRGPSLPELWGAYVFGDYTSGRIWALRPVPGGEADVQVIADTRRQIVSFGEGPDGELYVVTFDDGIGRLERAAPPADVEPLPERLSETGCFSDTATHTLAPGVIPYGVNARLWSDGADKLRAIALPAGAAMGHRDEEVFDFPPDTVLVKTFTLPGPDGLPRRIETRLTRRGEEGWNGYSYRWNEAQTDAELLPASATRTVETPDGPVEWQFPSRAQCDLCHIQGQGYALGLSTRQLNRRFGYPGGEADQLTALSRAGYVALPAAASALPAFPDIEDGDADIAARARAYLDANCASCHRPDGPANADIDLRATTALAATGLCDVAPGQGDLGLTDARLVAPGDPDRSVLLARMQVRGDDQMPPIASTVVDPFGTALVGAWIQTLPGCD